MKLNYWDLDWIHTKLKAYDIKYKEIYDEIFDHITSAIEEKIEAGDTRKLPELYEEVAITQFGGYLGIDKVAASYVSAYKSKVKKIIWENYRYYVNIQWLIFTLVLIALSFAMPRTKLTSIIFVVPLFLAALYSPLFVYFKMRRVKPARGQISLVYGSAVTQANLPLLFIYMLIWLPQIPSLFNDSYTYKLIDVPPAVLALMLSLFLVYDLSCMRLCRHELKGLLKIDGSH